jgi:hypothetical protein
MLEMLKKFEEESGGIEDLEGDDGNDLARRFQDIDLSEQQLSYCLLHSTYASRFNIDR